VILILFRSVMSISLSTSSLRAYEHDIMQLFLQTFALPAKGRKPLDTFFLPPFHLLRISDWFLLETNRPEMNRGYRKLPGALRFRPASQSPILLWCSFACILFAKRVALQ
jgi:hypothetical protein